MCRTFTAHHLLQVVPALVALTGCWSIPSDRSEAFDRKDLSAYDREMSERLKEPGFYSELIHQSCGGPGESFMELTETKSGQKIQLEVEGRGLRAEYPEAVCRNR